MTLSLNQIQLSLLQTDITQRKVDAIVNAANNTLSGGGGVDGAIHAAAGPDLLAECIKLNSCPTGESRITRAYKLPAKFVIHTVGPIWRGGHNNEARLLGQCYRNSLLLASQHELNSIAFPAISCGIYAYPLDQAAEIAIKEIQRFSVSPEYLEERSLKEIELIAYNDTVFNAINRTIQQIL